LEFMKKKILVACGTAIATATIVTEKLKDILARNKIDAEIIKCRVPEVPYYIRMLGKVDLILTTSFVPDVKNIPILNAVPLISGLGREELEREIVKALREEN